MMDFLLSKKVDRTPRRAFHFEKTDILGLDRNENVLIWFGHSSYYFQLNGKTFLVDPVFSPFAAPFYFSNKAFKGTTMYKAPDLPPIDFLILSHDHYDHLDYRTILSLRDQVDRVVCSLGVGQHFEYWGYNGSDISELDWFDNVDLGNNMNLTATPARHFSGRGFKRNKTLWSSFVLKTDDFNLFLGGDSGYDTFFSDIGEKFGPFDLAILEQGQYNKFWNNIHLLPSEIYKTAEQLNTKSIMPVHNSRFALSDHPWYEPLEKITENNNGLRLLTPKIGELVNLTDGSQTFEQWWKNWD